MLCDLIIYKIKSLKININYAIFGCKSFYHGFDFRSNLLFHNNVSESLK